MRSAGLFAVAVLAVILAASLFSPVAAISGISIHKVTTNGDTTTKFHIIVSGSSGLECNLISGGGCTILGAPPGTYTVVETVPPGWVLTNIDCQKISSSSFSFIANGVTIDYVAGDTVGCTITNSPAHPSAPVGGVVMHTNTLTLVTPWLAVIGLVGCIGTVLVVVKKRRQ